jgi:hypothetical protein
LSTFNSLAIILILRGNHFLPGSSLCPHSRQLSWLLDDQVVRHLPHLLFLLKTFCAIQRHVLVIGYLLHKLHVTTVTFQWRFSLVLLKI